MGRDAYGKMSHGPLDFAKAGLAGGICCSLTHGVAYPIDVVKSRMQLQPTVYNQGLVSAFKKVAAKEGVAAFAAGLGPAAIGYFVQGWFQFGGVEFFKIQASFFLGEEKAWNNRTYIGLGASAGAMFTADMFLFVCGPARIRLVADPALASGMLKAFPPLFKQVPYTMAKFSVQGAAAEAICNATGADTANVAVSVASGLIAGVAAAIISHPADTLLSKISKSPTAGGTGSVAYRLANLAKETSLKQLCLTGLGTRCVVIGAITAGQFGIFGVTMKAIGAEKFHFQPSDRFNNKTSPFVLRGATGGMGASLA